MTNGPLNPTSFARRKTLSQRALQQAADLGQTTLFNTLLELDDLCNAIDLAGIGRTHQLEQLAQSTDFLFAALDQSAIESLSIAVVRQLLEPIRRQIQNLYGGVDRLH